MKRLSLSLTLCALGLVAGVARAEDGPPKTEAKRPGAEFGGAFKKQLIAKFDKDGDGKLNEAERSAAQEEFKKRAGEGGGPGQEAFLKRFDKDGDGKLSDEEKAAAKEAFQKRAGEGRPEGLDMKGLLKRFDKDGDGKLSEEEKAAAKEAFKGAGGFPGRKPGDAKPEGARERKVPAALLEKFDKDGDGKLNEDEKKSAFEALKKRRAEQDK